MIKREMIMKDTPSAPDKEPHVFGVKAIFKEGKGFRITEVSEKSIAKDLDLKAGDFITGFGGKDLKNIKGHEITNMAKEIFNATKESKLKVDSKKKFLIRTYYKEKTFPIDTKTFVRPTAEKKNKYKAELENAERKLKAIEEREKIWGKRLDGEFNRDRLAKLAPLEDDSTIKKAAKLIGRGLLHCIPDREKLDAAKMDWQTDPTKRPVYESKDRRLSFTIPFTEKKIDIPLDIPIPYTGKKIPFGSPLINTASFVARASLNRLKQVRNFLVFEAPIQAANCLIKPVALVSHLRKASIIRDGIKAAEKLGEPSKIFNKQTLKATNQDAKDTAWNLAVAGMVTSSLGMLGSGLGGVPLAAIGASMFGISTAKMALILEIDADAAVAKKTILIAEHAKLNPKTLEKKALEEFKELQQHYANMKDTTNKNIKERREAQHKLKHGYH